LEVIPEKTLREELGPDPSTLRKYNISAVKITKSFKNARTIAARKAAEDIGSSYQTQLKYLQKIRQLAVAGMHIPSYIVWCFNY